MIPTAISPIERFGRTVVLVKLLNFRSARLFACAALLLAYTFATAQAASPRSNCFVGANDLADKTSPPFSDYPVTSSTLATFANLDVSSSRIARTYRTVIRQEMRKGANFAGHYRVAIWGCGSSCAQFAVVNLTTGRVITAKNIDSVSGVQLNADEFLPHTESDAWGFRFNKNSRLLVVLGTLNDDETKRGAFYFVLEGERLRSIHKTAAAPNTCTED